MPPRQDRRAGIVGGDRNVHPLGSSAQCLGRHALERVDGDATFARRVPLCEVTAEAPAKLAAVPIRRLRTDGEHQLIFRLLQRVGCRGELAVFVRDAVAVIFVERECSVAPVEVQGQRVEWALVGVVQVGPTGDNRPRSDVERHTLQRRVREQMRWPGDQFIGPPVVPCTCW